MPLTFNSFWDRSVKPLYMAGGTEFASDHYLTGYTHGTTTLSSFIADKGTILPGYVANITSGGVVKATSGSNNGAFYGLFFSEVSTDLDDCIGSDMPPTLLVAPCTAMVLKSALGGNTFIMDGTANNEELIAVNGVLTPRGNNTTSHTVAKLVAVDSGGAYIVVMLRDPSAFTV